jgi:hypothetical protein
MEIPVYTNVGAPERSKLLRYVAHQETGEQRQAILALLKRWL